MKKAITILAVLIVLVGAVFADETHTVKLKAEVAEIVPVFALKQGDYKTNTATLKQGSTTEYTTQYGEDDSYGMDNNNQALAVDFQLDEAGSVTFTALLLNQAKQNESYNLTFGGGVFAVKRGGTGESYAPTTITTTAGTNTDGLAIALGAAAPTGTATNKIVGLTFNGTKVAAVTASGYTLATAVYAYPGDATIDPTADGEYYYADVTLLVSAT